MPTARDRKGHLECRVTLMYKVTRECHTSGFYSNDFPGPKNVETKKRWTVWHVYRPSYERSLARSRDLDIQGHAWMPHIWLLLQWLCRPKKRRNKKKDERSSIYIAQVMKDHLQGHVTLTYKVTRECHTSGCYSNDFPGPKNVETKIKLNVPSFRLPDIGNQTWKISDLHYNGHVWRSRDIFGWF